MRYALCEIDVIVVLHAHAVSPANNSPPTMTCGPGTTGHAATKNPVIIAFMITMIDRLVRSNELIAAKFAAAPITMAKPVPTDHKASVVQLS